MHSRDNQFKPYMPKIVADDAVTVLRLALDAGLDGCRSLVGTFSVAALGALADVVVGGKSGAKYCMPLRIACHDA
jgi:hypothetical protein